MEQFVAPRPADSPEVFRTLVGSRLYGNDHANSDFDIFVVTTSRLERETHDMTDEGDFTHRGIDLFLRRVRHGHPMSCEAAFSPVKEFTADGDAWRPLIEGLRVTSPSAMERYERKIREFCFGGYKERFHATRLSFNLEDLRLHGRFDPVMSDRQKDIAHSLASMKGYSLIRKLIPDDTTVLPDNLIRTLERKQ